MINVSRERQSRYDSSVWNVALRRWIDWLTGNYLASLPLGRQSISRTGAWHSGKEDDQNSSRQSDEEG
ncbi:MAG TPA: hypothetical protein DEU95_10805 [Chloroflexi bacterium]|jgi:hypothetical protein|nr:hypothetical protein [Chloroflexota bacterium]HBY46918.1 hypothetical protein [Chloroflexota bacterium]HCG30204.1 hypothetical protein [Chloroflexota bacterium]